MEPTVQTPRAERAQHESDAAPLTPDCQQAGRFLRLIARDTPITFQTFGDSDDKDKGLARWCHGTLDQHKQTLTNLNQRGAGVFFMVNEGDGRARRSESVTRVRAVFVDLDEDGATGLAKVQAATIAPHAVVESSAGKFHCYWSVDCPLNRFTAVQEALAVRFGADPKVKDLPRVMPGARIFSPEGRPLCIPRGRACRRLRAHSYRQFDRRPWA